MSWFDESRLDDPAALGAADGLFRALAEAGPRVRRDATAAEPALRAALAEGRAERPRAVIAAGPDSRLLRAVLEPFCPVPFVAWPSPSLPGWAGGLDLVVVLAPQGGDTGAAAAVAEAVRRGCRVVVACPEHSLVAEHAAQGSGRDVTVLPTETGDQLATAVVMLSWLAAHELGPVSEATEVAAALDEVAVDSSPHRDLAVNPAKMLAIALADTAPVVWGGSVLAARAARRVAESLRRASGRAVLAGDAEHLLPVLERARRKDLFDDPFADADSVPSPLLLILDDGAEAPVVREQRGRLTALAVERGLRVETLASAAPSEVARYASLVQSGAWAAAYLRLGLVDD